MGKTIEKQLEVLTQRLAELYYIKRDHTGLSGFLSDKVSWIGTGVDEICFNKEDAARIFAEEIETYDGYFLIKKSWYHAVAIDQSCAVVMAKLTVETPLDTHYLVSMPLRFSVIWVKEKELWKIVHIHNSIADKNMQEDTYFNIDRAKSAYSQLNDKLIQAVNTDALTGINNMRGFINDTEQLFQDHPDEAYAIVKFGIKNFRYINRTNGYKMGDKVLQTIARYLSKMCLEGEACGRIEKDIFAVTLRFYTKDELLYRLERDIKEKLNDNRMRNELYMEIHFTGGVYQPQDIQHEHVIDMLDKALIAQQSIPKSLAGSHLFYYENHMMETMINKNKLLESAVPAMQNEEFILYIQPQFDIDTREVVSGEALCRWKKADGAFISPNEFIPVFEEYGMIINFDFHMLEMLCKKLRSWMDQGLAIKPISVNQSRLHIGNQTYFEDFCATVDRYKIPHEYIAFELTESAFVEQQDDMLDLAIQLHKRGFLLAIDDFGTGYASLNFLSVVSADILKIDKCLLDGIENSKKARSIIEKTIELAHEIDMTVICEGIEKECQLEYLKKIHCDIGQGFLIGRPMVAEGFSKEFLEHKVEKMKSYRRGSVK